jgi:hypothetical protein
MFVAEFATQRDREKVWMGSPWHVSKNAVILSEFEEHMKPSELKFDRLSMWARVMDLPFHLRDKKWWRPIAEKIDKQAKEVQFDHVGGFLRARVTIEVSNPLQRWVLIESGRRKCMDLYDIQYEQAPHFCFSCGRIGHADILCPTPGTRDANGDLPFGKGLRAPDDWKRSSFSEGTSGGWNSSKNDRSDSKFSRTAAQAGREAVSPPKNVNANKRKAYVPKVNTRADLMQIENGEAGSNVERGIIPYSNAAAASPMAVVEEVEDKERDPKKKKPTPTHSENSAAAVEQPCQSQ